jgi:hypothetical protein
MDMWVGNLNKLPSRYRELAGGERECFVKWSSHTSQLIKKSKVVQDKIDQIEKRYQLRVAILHQTRVTRFESDVPFITEYRVSFVPEVPPPSEALDLPQQTVFHSNHKGLNRWKLVDDGSGKLRQNCDNLNEINEAKLLETLEALSKRLDSNLKSQLLPPEAQSEVPSKSYTPGIFDRGKQILRSWFAD